MSKATAFFLALFILMSTSLMAQKKMSYFNANEKPTHSATDQFYLVLEQFDQAMMKKNVAMLKNILQDTMTMAHSNGLVQTKEDVLRSIETERIVYNEITYGKCISISMLDDELTDVVRDLQVKGYLEGKEFDVSLKTNEQWVKADGQWKLAKRQSHKSNE